MKKQFRLAHHIYLAYRGLARIGSVPFRGMKEGPAKNRVRKVLLKFQHSLPTEFAVNAGDTVVQIGTPSSKTLHRFRRAVGDSGKLVVVEAMPDNQERLAKAIAEAGYKNVALICGAACNENKQGELAVSPHRGDHKIDLEHIRMDNDLRPGNETMAAIQVEFMRLDDALPKVGVTQIDFLSVTVNGAEAEVLKGATKVLQTNRSGARIYAKGHALDKNGEPLHKETQSIMQGLGYETVITRGEPSSTLDEGWLWRAGDLYAWKP